MGVCFLGPSNPPYDSTLSPEENAFLSTESSLGYSQHPVAQLVESLRKNSSDQKISSNQFNTISSEFHLNTKELDTVDSPLFSFYRYFRSKGVLNLPKMIVAASILGRGNTKDRVHALFSEMPGLKGDKATVDSVHWVVSSVFHISARSIPDLTQSQPPHNTITTDQIKAYQTRLEANLPQAEPAAEQRLLGGRETVTRDEVVTALEGNEGKENFLKPGKAREFILREEFRPK